MMNKYITWHGNLVNKFDRHMFNQHKSCVLWFTGLSGSGKSTLANAVDKQLFDLGIRSYVLDGDNIRHGLNSDLCFSNEDRIENIRRIGEVSKLFVDSGLFVLTAFISPFLEDRNRVRRLFPEGEFIEIFIDCPLSICERRDPKGLYRKARKGEIQDFTGIDSPYESPINPDLTIHTGEETLADSCNKVINYLKEKKLI